MMNLGGYMVREAQILWRGSACVAFFPEVQLIEGHLIVTNLTDAHHYSKWSPEEVREAASMKFRINRGLCGHFKAQATTLYVQTVDDELWKKTIIHIIPRSTNDLPDNDLIYKMLASYPLQLLAANRENAAQSQILKKVCSQRDQFSNILSKQA